MYKQIHMHKRERDISGILAVAVHELQTFPAVFMCEPIL